MPPMYSTKGTVQIHTIDETSLKFDLEISPARSHTVTVEKEDLIVFTLQRAAPPSAPAIPTSPNAVIFEKRTRFSVHRRFNPVLLAAATGSLCLELIIDQDMSLNEIVGVVFPART